MKIVNWRDVLIRALKTFVQTAASYLITNLAGVDFFGGDAGATFWTGLALSAGAAGLSAVWNGVIAPIVQPKPPNGDEANG